MIKILMEVNDEKAETKIEMEDVGIGELQAAYANLEIAKTTVMGQLMKMSESQGVGLTKTESDEENEEDEE